MDEAEHFLRSDTEAGRENATSMKRLLEELEKVGAVVFVAGHWSAWDALPDYLDRFSPSEPVDLLRLFGRRRATHRRQPDSGLG